MESIKEDDEKIGILGIVAVIICVAVVFFILFGFIQAIKEGSEVISEEDQANFARRAVAMDKTMFKFKELVGSYQINSKEQTISLLKKNFPQVANFSKGELDLIVDQATKTKKFEGCNLQQKFRRLIGWYRDNGDGTISFKTKNFANFSSFSQEELQELINQGLPKKRSFW